MHASMPDHAVPAVGCRSAIVGAMAHRDGNGWIRCAQGHRHWGRYGAAGVLACAPGRAARDQAGPDKAALDRSAPGQAGLSRAEPGQAGLGLVLLQRRSWWVNHGGTWGPPGGARDSHESVITAALREAAEECAIPPCSLSIRGVLAEDHGGWAYHTVLAAADEPFAARAASTETSEVAWVPVTEVSRLELHPGFAAQWPLLRDALAPLTVIVDAANVMGSRPDGWWRDRAGAAVRLGRELSALAGQGISGLPDSVPAPPLDRWYPRFVLVVEGAARPAAARDLASADVGQADGGPAGPGPSELARPDPVQVVAAEGSGDDAIAAMAGQLPGRRLVVTADRELRGRCQAAGAAVTGPRWLLGLLRPGQPGRPGQPRAGRASSQ